MVQRYIMDVRFIIASSPCELKKQTWNLLPSISELMSNKWKRFVLQLFSQPKEKIRKNTSKSMWFVSREEVVCPHYAGQPFKGPGASLCLGSQASECQSLASSQGPARAAAGRAGTHRRGKLAACLAAQQPFWGAHGNHLLTNIFLEGGYGLWFAANSPLLSSSQSPEVSDLIFTHCCFIHSDALIWNHGKVVTSLRSLGMGGWAHEEPSCQAILPANWDIWKKSCCSLPVARALLPSLQSRLQPGME